MKSLKIAPFVLVLLLGFFLGCGAADDDKALGQAGGSTGIGTGRGQQAPAFRLTTLDGDNLDLASLEGKAVLLDFWDTWCPPCRKALPHLQELSVEHAGDLVVVGIALGQEGEAKVRSFVAQNGLTFPFAVGSQEVFENYRVSNLPTTFLLDRSGKVRKHWVGGYPKSEYDNAIKQVIGG